MPPRAKPKTPYRQEIEARRTDMASFALGSKSNLTQELATQRLAVFLQSLPDPDLTLKSAGLSRSDLRRLEKDDEVTQCIDKRIEAVVSTPWRLEPNQTRINKWLNAEIAPHVEGIIRGAIEAVLYGYNVQEVIYRKGERTGIARVTSKPFEWFFFTLQGELRYRPNDGGGGAEGVECDPLKFLLTRNRPSYTNPYGEALISRLWWPVYYRANIWAFRVQALERFGTPLIVGKTMGDRTDFANQLSGLASNAVVAIGDQDQVDFAEAANTGNAFSEAEQELVARIQKLILGQTLTSQMGKSGSFAAAKVHQDVMTDKRNADIRLVTQTVQTLVNNLCTLNNIPSPPLFVMADDTGLEMARAERDKVLVDAGMIKLTREYFLDRYDFGEGDIEIVEEEKDIKDEFSVIDEPGTDDAEMGTKLITLSRKKQQFTPQQQEIEDAADALLEMVPEPIPINAMLNAVKAANDPADLAVRLSLLLDQRDPRFTELLARAQFAAQTLGYVVSEQESPMPKAAQMAVMPPLTMHITAPITMAAPEPQTVNVKLEAQPANVIVNMPEQAAPVLNIDVAAPSVQITNEVQPAAVELSLPPRKTVTEIERDAQGDITRAMQTESDS